MNTDHYSITYIRASDGATAVALAPDATTAWALMRELDSNGVVAGFPKAIFK